MSMVIVIGPTPPGTGVINDAFGSHSAKSTSPVNFPSALPVHADVDDDCAVLYHIAL